MIASADISSPGGVRVYADDALLLTGSRLNSHADTIPVLRSVPGGDYQVRTNRA